jgi:DNA-binding MarR family transcriptional regulator
VISQADELESDHDVTDFIARDVAMLALETFLPHRLSLLSSLTAQALAAVHGPHGLNTTEWIVLATIAESPQTTAKDIGAIFHMQKAKVSRAVSALLRRNLISRTPKPGDHRLVLLELTSKGRALYEKCAPAAADLARRLEEPLELSDREILLRSLLKLAQAAQLLISGLTIAAPVAQDASGAPQS